MTRSAVAQRRRPAPPPALPPSISGGHKLAAVFGVLLVVVSIVAIFLFVQNQLKAEKVANADNGEEARRAACYYVPEIIAFDYRNLDPFFEKMLAGATGEWKQGFAESQERMRKVITDAQMISEAGDTSCGLVSAEGNTATVVIAAAQSLATVDAPGPRPAQVAMVAVMEKHDGKWLCAKLDAPLFA